MFTEKAIIKCEAVFSDNNQYRLNEKRKVQGEAGEIDTICNSDTVGNKGEYQCKVSRAEWM